MFRRGIFLALGFVVFSSLLPVTGVAAKKLDKAACKTLKSERAEFLKSGILDEMAKGPEWVKDNLAFDRVIRIKRYLDLDAVVIFQCPNGGGPKITHKKKPASKAQARKKKILRKKVLRKKKKTSALAFDPFSSN